MEERVEEEIQKHKVKTRPEFETQDTIHVNTLEA